MATNAPQKPAEDTNVKAFEWKKCIACISCYKTLAELGQFNEESLGFDEAGATLLKDLNYWPASSSSLNLRQMSAMLLTQRYVHILSRSYVLTAQQPDANWKVVKRTMEAILINPKNSICDLAAAIDDLIKFEDEV